MHFLAIVLVGFFLNLLAGDSHTGSEPKVKINDENKLDTVNIGRLICGGHLPLAIVEKKFQGHQLKRFQLQTIQNHDWNDVVEDMQSGKLAGTFILSPLAMNLIREGFPGKIVMTADRNGNGFVLSDKIKSIEQLKKQKRIIAVPHIYSQHNVLLHIFMRQHAIPQDNIIVVGMPPRDMIGSLRRGEIDGFIVGEPEGNKSIELGVGWMVAISPDIWKDHMDHVLLVTDRFIEERPQQLQELVIQLLHAGAFIEANPHEAAVMGEDYTGSPASVFERVLTDPPDWIDYSDMTPHKTDIVAMAQYLITMGLWDNAPVNPEHYLDLRFINQE
ncbi:MAG: ABC transporter substrate-binding protein [Gammaproteobacteria bacterium]|nr:ABC transporter substrate-binding protein [Gammaproteobacteria bacterium]